MIPTPEPIVQVTDAPVMTGESPLWDHRDGSLYFADVVQPAICRVDARGAFTSWQMPTLLGALALAHGGGLIFADKDEVHRFDPATGETAFIVNPERARPEMRFNDGRVDGAGRLWVGSLRPRLMTGGDRPFQPDNEPAGWLWRVSADGSATAMAKGIDAPNGLGWSPDGRWLYHTDSMGRRIDVYAFDVASGEVGERRTFAEVPHWRGMPDGLAVDAEGGVWSANIYAGAVTRYAPDGSIDRVIYLPVRNVSSLTFGGEDLDTLYMTTFTHLLAESELPQQPLAGHVLALKPGVRGLRENLFGGV